MRMSITLMTCMCLLMSGCFFTNEDSFRNQYEEQYSKINFRLLEESTYNEKEVKKGWGINKTTPFIFFESVDDKDTLEVFSTAGEFEYSGEFDFEKHCMLIAYGREIEDLECTKHPDFKSMHYLRVTLQDMQSERKVYLYQIDKRNYVPSDLAIECYVMVGDERIYAGENIEMINDAIID